MTNKGLSDFLFYFMSAHICVCVHFMCVCVTKVGAMHIHPCMADSGRQEEERKMERQNWASERQSSLHPQSEC